MDKKKASFSLHEFKNWLSEQKSDTANFFLDGSSNDVDPNEKYIGRQVIAKVSDKKLLEKIEVGNGDPEQLVQELVENGGVIIGVEGKNLLIEVELGTFYMPRFCLKMKKE